jgi:hypothetical protein
VKAAAVLTRTLDPCDSERFDEIRTGEIDWVGVDVGSWVIPPMQCFLCDSEMSVVMVEPYYSIDMHVFDHRTFRCARCGDTEKTTCFALEAE